MANWYDKYMTIYGKPFSEVPEDIIQGTRNRLAALQSPEPLASIVVIGYNEETHLQACLWAISEIRCKYPVEIIGVDNDSTNRTAEIYEKSGNVKNNNEDALRPHYCYLSIKIDY